MPNCPESPTGAVSQHYLAYFPLIVIIHYSFKSAWGEDSSYQIGGSTSIHFSDMVHQSLYLLCGREVEVLLQIGVHFGIKVTDGENKKPRRTPLQLKVGKHLRNMIFSVQLHFFLLEICILIARLEVMSRK